MYYESHLFSIAWKAVWCYYALMRTSEYLYGNRYPGRIIAAGLTPSGRTVYAYAIMGRSPNSRNRVFRLEDGGLYTRPFDPALVKDPSLIIYPAILKSGENIIVTNGDQTLDIKKALDAGFSMEKALVSRTYEPDEPNFTPRISLVISPEGFEFAINRRTDDGSCERPSWKYPAEKGVLHIIHTYDCDGNPLPSFSGAPRELEAEDDYAEKLWNSLDRENRISLYVNEGGNARIFNAREGD